MDKLSKLNKKIQTYKEKHKGKELKKSKVALGSLNVSLEIIGAIFVGLLIGFYLDKFFNTGFLFKIICLILAFVASLMNIYRTIDKK